MLRQAKPGFCGFADGGGPAVSLTDMSGLCAYLAHSTHIAPLLRRSLTTQLLSRRSPPRIPPQDGDHRLLTFHNARPYLFRVLDFKSPVDFLKAIGRSSETKLPIEDWDKFWNIDARSRIMKGMSVQDRRFVMDLSMSKYFDV
jgi:hypothetical protein